MGVVSAVADLAVAVFSLTIAVAAPLMDAQTVLAPGLHPAPLVELKRWCAAEYGTTSWPGPRLLPRPHLALIFFVSFCVRGFDFFFLFRSVLGDLI